MVDTQQLSEIRRDYESNGMRKSDLDADPFVQFENWLNHAFDLKLIDSTAMTLATSTPDGVPSARIVLLKNFDHQGFCWFTDSRSQKGQQLAQNPHAALLFHWRDLNRQVRIQGVVERLPERLAEDYFNSRPQGSRFSAAASCQTAVVKNRDVLVTEVERLQALYADGEVKRNEAWIGYRLKPDYFEFWQGLVNRLHDRLVYRAAADAWFIERLSP